MAESKATLRYNAFESLKSRFSSSNSPAGQANLQQPARREPGAKRRSRSRQQDEKLNPPPLVPLVEEGDLIQEHMQLNTLSYTRGKWNHSAVTKVNHLYSPEFAFDALETASVTSCSSAYSSRSESSVLSPDPSYGSITELSDTGSCDTYQEYDMSRAKPKIEIQPHLLQVDTLRRKLDNCVSTCNGDFGIVADELPDQHVRSHAEGWNKIIGDWKFEGISPSPASPSSLCGLRVTNEVRLPTPNYTPLGSMDNLMESDSRSSLLSSGDEISSRNIRLGSFVHRRSMSTSNLASAFQPMNSDDIQHIRSFSGTDLFVHREEERFPAFEKPPREKIVRRLSSVDNTAIDKGTTISTSTSTSTSTTGTTTTAGEKISETMSCQYCDGDERALEKAASHEEEKMNHGETAVHCEEKLDQDHRSEKPEDVSGKQQDSNVIIPTQSGQHYIKIQKISDRVKLLRANSSPQLNPPLPSQAPPTILNRPPGGNKWQEAYHRSKKLMTVQESNQSKETSSNEKKETYSVRKRAELFGGSIM